MDETLTVNVKELSKLHAQVAPNSTADAQQVAAEWLIPGAVRP